MNDSDWVKATPERVVEYINHALETSQIKNVYVLAHNPARAEVLIKRSWQRRIQKLLRQQAAASDPKALINLGNQITIMKSITFAVAPPADLLEADVLILRPDELTQTSPSKNALIIKVIL